MKDRVREATFNLIGPAVKNRFVLDLFAGTGAMALEAISRGALRATAVERRFPSARTIKENAATLGVEQQVEIVTADVFSWWRTAEIGRQHPWLVFCCPPYILYTEREAEMLCLVKELMGRAPANSLLVLEFDRQFEASQLPSPEDWDVRGYPPARIAIHAIA